MSEEKGKNGRLIRKGNRFSIYAAITENGACPFYDEYLKPLTQAINAGTAEPADEEALSKLWEYFDKFADHGRWSNSEQLKPVEGRDFYEFKVKRQHRVFFYYDTIQRKVIILTHHTIKKKGKISKEDLQRMEDIRASFESRRMKDG